MSRTTLVPALVSIVSMLAAGCSDDEPGTITATVYGEEFIEEGIPADEFSDGWAVRFDTFLVSVGNVAAKAGEGGAEVGDPTFHIVDLAQPSGGAGFELATFDAPAGTYDHYGYALRADAAATGVNADAAAVAAMTQAGYSVWVQGSATNAGVTKTFDWGFTMKLGFAHCEITDKIDGNHVEVQATIHADHLFYDDAVSPEPALAFQLIADADGADGTTADGEITMAELAATDIRAQTRYQVGSLRDPSGAAVENLRQYIEVQVTTLGHINGEGHCEDVIVMP